MNIEMSRDFLLWSAIVNYALLIIWFVAFVYAHDFIYRLHTRWFRLTVEQFDALNYVLIGFYKIGVLLLNVVPYIALSFSHLCG